MRLLDSRGEYIVESALLHFRDIMGVIITMRERKRRSSHTSEYEILGLINGDRLPLCRINWSGKPPCLISMMDQSNPRTSFAIPMPDIMAFIRGLMPIIVGRPDIRWIRNYSWEKPGK